MGRWRNNRAENSHLPSRRRERAMLRFRQMKSLQKFASVHAQVHNHFNSERHLVDRQTYRERRSAALAEWRIVMGRSEEHTSELQSLMRISYAVFCVKKKTVQNSALIKTNKY